MTVEQSSLSHRVSQRGDDAKTYDTIKEVTGISDVVVIKEAISACKNNEGTFKVEDVVAMLLGDESERKKQVVKPFGDKPFRDVTDALPQLAPSGRVSSDVTTSSTQKPEGAGAAAAAASGSGKAVIDLTGSEPPADRDELQKAIAASLQDNQGILGGQVTREEQDISRVLEASLAESKAGTKRKRGEVWFVDPLNPHERKRTEGWPVGLKNVGNTCWFSAVIQSLFHLRKFRHLVLNFKVPTEGATTSINDRRNLRFMHELRSLFALLVGSNKKYVDPSKAVDILKEAFSSPTGANDSQQDVSEFQHKLLEWLEDAFKTDRSHPTSPQEVSPGSSKEEDHRQYDNPVVDLFYGQFQAEGYHEGKGFLNEETFGQFPLQVNGFRDIHESLEGATAQGEIEAVSSEVTQKSGQELWFSRLPPVLTFELSRFQFNQQLGRPEKIHNKIEFPKVIYMDRYMESNKSLTRQRREEARKLKDELTLLHAKLDKFLCYGSGSKRFPLQDVLTSVLEFAGSKSNNCNSLSASHDVEMESPKPNIITNSTRESPNSLNSTPSNDVAMSSPLPVSPGRPAKVPPDVPNPSPRHVSDSELQVLQDCLRRWRTEVENDVRELQENISRLDDKVNSMYSDQAMQKFPYHLHAVLVHEGQAASGHYWAYIYDPIREKWLKFNDITVSESGWEELEKESMGGYHNASAYCLMYVDRTRLESTEGKQAAEQMEILPPDLSDLVMDDNKKFSKEQEDWDREIAMKKESEVTITGEHRTRAGQTIATQTAHISQRINLPLVHASLSVNETIGVVRNMIEMIPSKPAHDVLCILLESESKSLGHLEKQFPEKPVDDLRLKLVSLYLFMNGTDEETQKWVLLEQISYLKILDQEARSKLLRGAATEMITSLQRERGEQGHRLHEENAYKSPKEDVYSIDLKPLQAWHRKFHQFREAVYLFVKGLDAYYKERFAEAMPYLNIAWHYNTEVIEGKSEKLGMSKKLVAFYQRECLEKLNAWSAQMFETEDDISEMLTTMMDLVLPSMPALFQSGFSDDTASAEEMRERWCSFLGQDLDDYKVEKLQEILSKLFEPASETKSVRTPPVRLTDMTELYFQYKSVMATADRQGDLDLVLKVT